VHGITQRSIRIDQPTLGLKLVEQAWRLKLNLEQKFAQNNAASDIGQSGVSRLPQRKIDQLSILHTKAHIRYLRRLQGVWF